MSGKAERQLKELRRLMPWNWDSRVELHPPGEKAMHDFEDVLNYAFDQKRTRAPAPAPAPASAPAPTAPASRKDAKRRLSPEGGAPVVPNAPGLNSEVTHQGKVSSVEFTAPPSTARHPAADNQEVSENATVVTEQPSECPSLLKNKGAPVAIPEANSAGTISAGKKQQQSFHGVSGRDFATPAINKRLASTPASRVPSGARPPSGPFSDNRPALADGQFQPTPLPTPRSVVGNAQNKTIGGVRGNGGGFRSPPPRTAFAQKKRKTESAAAAPGVGSATAGPLLPAASSAVDYSPMYTAPQPVNRPVPTPGRKGLRNTPTRPNTNISFTIHPKAVAAAAPVRANAENEDLPIDLEKFGKGPVIRRPPTCPPLFKQSAGGVPRSGSKGKAASGALLASPPGWKSLGSPPLMQPPPSSQKRDQANALNGQFFGKEKGLLAVLNGGKNKNGQKKEEAPLQEVGGQMGGAAPPPLSALTGTFEAVAQPHVEQQPAAMQPQLLWACKALSRQQK